MKTTLFGIIPVFLFALMSCGNSTKEKELELRERELELREKELSYQKEGSASVYQNTQQANSYTPTPAPTPPREQEPKQDLYTREASEPNNYLSAEYSYKVSMIGNTIIEGELNNNATKAGFKNVKMTLYLYSKTDALLGKVTFTVMEFVPAHGFATFRHKVNKWWDNVTSTKLVVISAEPYEQHFD